MLTTLYPTVTMIRVIRFSGRAQPNIASRSSPITKVPPEIIREVFKLVVLSSEEARSHGVKSLCLVDKCWNDIANATSDLWTKVTLAYPFHADQLSASQKWLKASEPKVIDVEVDFRDPARYEYREEDLDSLADPAPLRGVVAVLCGSEHRWRSISVNSDTWSPIQKFAQAWVTPSLPALESISFDSFARSLVPYIPVVPQRLTEWPALFGRNWTPMPKLREVTLCAIPVDWTPAAVISFQNLRKLVVINRPNEVGPTFEQFSTVLAASPRLETLEVAGYHPFPGDPHTQAQTALVHLPALKHLVFEWSCYEFAYYFLAMFQIPETLETLSLAEECGLEGSEAAVFNSSQIFNLLANLGSGSSKDRDPSRPWISMLGLKRLSVTWVQSKPYELIALLQKAPIIEEIYLTDVGKTTLEAIATLAETHFPKRLNIHCIWSSVYKSEEARLFAERLQGLGLEVIAKLSGEVGRDIIPIKLGPQLNKEDAERAL